MLVAGCVSIALAIFVIISRLIENEEMLFSVTLLLQILPWVGGAAGLWLLTWGWLRRVRLFDAALRADETLGLKERLSSALQIRNPTNEPELAVLEDAARAAQAIRPRRAFRMQLQKEMWWALGPTAVLAVAWFFLPPMDLLAKHEEQGHDHAVEIEARQETARRLQELANEISEATELRKPAMVEQVERELKSLAKQITDAKLSNEQAMAKMANMKDKLNVRRKELEKRLAMPGNLQAGGQGKFTRDAAKAIKQGNFAKAAKLLEELKDKLQRGALSKEERASVQRELKMLAGKLDEGSPLAAALAKAGQELEAGNFNVALAELESSIDELENLEFMLAELELLESLDYDLDARNLALNGKPGICEECGEFGMLIAGVCSECGQTGAWRPGDSREQGSGMGGAGIGKGGIAEKEEGDVGFRKSRIKGDMRPGKIIAKMKMPGKQAPGEITTEYESLRMEYAQRAEDTIQHEMLPLEDRSLVRNYFDAISVGETKSDASDSTQP